MQKSSFQLFRIICSVLLICPVQIVSAQNTNGVNTTVNLGGPAFDDGDPYPNFFGTSAAAPHVAAVGALLIQGRKKFNLQTTVTPAEIRQQLISSAGKFSYLPGNFSFEGGYGFAQADSAIAQIVAI